MDPDKLQRIEAGVTALAQRVERLATQFVNHRHDAGYDESKHPRAGDGKFGSGGGGGKTHPSARSHPTNTHAPMKRKAGEDINSYMSRAVQERDARKSAASTAPPRRR